MHACIKETMKILSIFITALFLFSCNSSENSGGNSQNTASGKKPFNRDSLITTIKIERDSVAKFAEKPFVPSIAGTLNYNRFRLFQKHFIEWQEYNFYPDVEPVIKEYGEVLKTAMGKTFPQIRKSYALQLQKSGNFKNVEFETLGSNSETLAMTSKEFTDTSDMRILRDRIKPVAQRYRFEQLQFFGSTMPFVVNLDSFKDDTIVFTPN